MALITLVTFNNYNFTRLALKYLVKNTNLTENRIIVVDNGSTDGTPDKIKLEFPSVESIIINDKNNLARAFNKGIGQLKLNEDFVYVPNDVCVGVDWLKNLKEDIYRYDFVGCGSPYMPLDLYYDAVINKQWADKYYDINDFVGSKPESEQLQDMLDRLYGGDFDAFCKDFNERNKDSIPLDEALTHIMYHKSWVFDKIGNYDERYDPLGNEDSDFRIRMNNAEIYRICSNRSYAHHWLSITQRQRFGERTEIQERIHRSAISLLQRWKPTKEEYYNPIERDPVLNWRTNYRKFDKIEPELSYEEAVKIPGIKFMLFDGLKPGEDYFSQIQPGTILEDEHGSFKLCFRNDDKLYTSNDDMGCDIVIRKEDFNKFYIKNYFRQEEKNHWGW